MSDTKWIATLPGDGSFQQFENLPYTLYPANSPRKQQGHEPADQFLDGCFVLLRDGIPVARYALYFNPYLLHQDEQTACIGSYECEDNPETAALVLQHALEQSAAGEAGYLIGPMEGSTWNNYRFSDHNDFPNFWMEPFHHSYYGKHFRENGFEQIGEYRSNIERDLAVDETSLIEREATYREMGAVFRNLKMDDFHADLLQLAGFCNEVFQENFLFSPIDARDFVSKYGKAKSVIDPELVWVVEDQAGEIHALFFALPDLMDPKKETLIVKTIARKKDSPFKGISAFLADKTFVSAKQKGMTQAIHAYFRVENASANISQKHQGEPYKSYSLFAKATGT